MSTPPPDRFRLVRRPGPVLLTLFGVFAASTARVVGSATLSEGAKLQIVIVVALTCLALAAAYLAIAITRPDALDREAGRRPLSRPPSARSRRSPRRPAHRTKRP